MNPKTLRKQILKALYAKRAEDFTGPQDLLSEIKVSEDSLDIEIRYLEEKYLVNIIGKSMGKRYLNFAGVKITADGVDLVEDPEEFNKMFTIKIHNNQFGDLKHSNVSIDSGNVNQSTASKSIDKIRKWYEKPLGRIFIGLVVLVVGASVVYIIGWN